jgi:hypothetical protein
MARKTQNMSWNRQWGTSKRTEALRSVKVYFWRDEIVSSETAQGA